MDINAYPSDISPRTVEYDIGEKSQIVLPNEAPFDGSPVLIRLASGWVEAWWADSDPIHDEMNGDHDDYGFCWVCLDDMFQAELDEALEWLPMNEGNANGN